MIESYLIFRLHSNFSLLSNSLGNTISHELSRKLTDMFLLGDEKNYVAGSCICIYILIDRFKKKMELVEYKLKAV